MVMNGSDNAPGMLLGVTRAQRDGIALYRLSKTFILPAEVTMKLIMSERMEL